MQFSTKQLIILSGLVATVLANGCRLKNKGGSTIAAGSGLVAAMQLSGNELTLEFSGYEAAGLAVDESVRQVSVSLGSAGACTVDADGKGASCPSATTLQVNMIPSNNFGSASQNSCTGSGNLSDTQMAFTCTGVPQPSPTPGTLADGDCCIYVTDPNDGVFAGDYPTSGCVTGQARGSTAECRAAREAAGTSKPNNGGTGGGASSSTGASSSSSGGSSSTSSSGGEGTGESSSSSSDVGGGG